MLIYIDFIGVTECMWRWISNSASDAQLHRLCSGFIQKKISNPMEFGFEWRSKLLFTTLSLVHVLPIANTSSLACVWVLVEP